MKNRKKRNKKKKALALKILKKMTSLYLNPKIRWSEEDIGLRKQLSKKKRKKSRKGNKKLQRKRKRKK